MIKLNVIIMILNVIYIKDIIIIENPDQVTKAKANPKLVGWFVGQVMKSTGGKANPKLVNELVQKKLVT